MDPPLITSALWAEASPPLSGHRERTDGMPPRALIDGIHEKEGTYRDLMENTIFIVYKFGVCPNLTTFLLDKLTVEIHLKFNNYSDIDQHVSTGQSLCQDL